MTTGRRLILNDGTILEDGEAGLAQDHLWLWFSGLTMQEAASMCFDPEKMSRIVFQYGEMEDSFDGFTACIAMQIGEDGRISVCLVKGE